MNYVTVQSHISNDAKYDTISTMQRNNDCRQIYTEKTTTTLITTISLHTKEKYPFEMMHKRNETCEKKREREKGEKINLERKHNQCNGWVSV